MAFYRCDRGLGFDTSNSTGTENDVGADRDFVNQSGILLDGSIKILQGIARYNFNPKYTTDYSFDNLITDRDCVIEKVDNLEPNNIRKSIDIWGISGNCRMIDRVKTNISFEENLFNNEIITKLGSYVSDMMYKQIGDRYYIIASCGFYMIITDLELNIISIENIKARNLFLDQILSDDTWSKMIEAHNSYAADPKNLLFGDMTDDEIIDSLGYTERRTDNNCISYKIIYNTIERYKNFDSFSNYYSPVNYSDIISFTNYNEQLQPLYVNESNIYYAITVSYSINTFNKDSVVILSFEYPNRVNNYRVNVPFKNADKFTTKGKHLIVYKYDILTSETSIFGYYDTSSDFSLQFLNIPSWENDNFLLYNLNQKIIKFNKSNFLQIVSATINKSNVYHICTYHNTTDDIFYMAYMNSYYYYIYNSNLEKISEFEFNYNTSIIMNNICEYSGYMIDEPSQIIIRPSYDGTYLYMHNNKLYMRCSTQRYNKLFTFQKCFCSYLLGDDNSIDLNIDTNNGKISYDYQRPIYNICSTDASPSLTNYSRSHINSYIGQTRLKFNCSISNAFNINYPLYGLVSYYNKKDLAMNVEKDITIELKDKFPSNDNLEFIGIAFYNTNDNNISHMRGMFIGKLGGDRIIRRAGCIDITLGNATIYLLNNYDASYSGYNIDSSNQLYTDYYFN